MIFTELVLQNFGPYAGRHTINLRPEIQPESRPIILFGGMNGGGKTTIMDAIRLALYGQRAQCSTRGNLSYNDFLIQCVNQQTFPIDQTRIELAFEHIRNDQWVEWRIVRNWTRNPKDGKDSLGILDGEWPDSALADTWDEYIENLLPLGISNLFLFDGEQVKELAEQDTPPQPVIEAIQSLLGLHLAERLAMDLDILVSRKRKALASASQLANLAEIEAKIKELSQQKKDRQEKSANAQNQLEKARQKERDAYAKFRTEGGRIAAERSQLESKIKDLGERTETQRQVLRDLSAGCLPLNLISPLLKQARIQANKELKYQQARIARDVLQERDKRLLEYISQLSLKQRQLEQIQSFLEQDNQALDLQINQDEKPWLGIDQEGLKQLENCLEHQLPIQLQQAEERKEIFKQLEGEIDFTERQLAVAASPEAYEKLDKDLKQARQEYFAAKEAYDNCERQSEEIKKSLTIVKKELEKYSEETIDRQNNEHIIQSAAKVKQTLELFRERLSLKKLNKLEGEVTECFRYLLHKSELVHRVAIDTENFSLSLFNPEGEPIPKHRLSAGEKQLLAIAFLWGLARVSGRSLPVAIDTPLGRLDSFHRSNLVERYFPTASHQVILLSTDTEIAETEIEQLRQQDAIAQQYLLEYDASKRQTKIHPNRYFW